MNKFLKLISWKRDSGRWDKDEIVFDIVIIILLVIIPIGVYLYV